MDKYRINITPSAAEDMRKIYEYISTELKAHAAAMNQYDRITRPLRGWRFSLNE